MFTEKDGRPLSYFMNKDLLLSYLPDNFFHKSLGEVPNKEIG